MLANLLYSMGWPHNLLATSLSIWCGPAVHSMRVVGYPVNISIYFFLFSSSPQDFFNRIQNQRQVPLFRPPQSISWFAYMAFPFQLDVRGRVFLGINPNKVDPIVL